MRLATMTSVFRKNREDDPFITYIESIRRCKEAGFTTLDFNMCAMSDRKTELNDTDWLRKTEAIRNEADRLGIGFSQSHPPYKKIKTPHYPLPEDEAFYVDITRRAIIISGMLGVKWAVMHPATEYGFNQYDMEANVKLNREVYDPFVELAEQHKVGLAFENMRDTDSYRRFGSTADELIALIDDYHCDSVRACWDFGHAHRVYTDQVRPLHQLGKRLKALHVDDNHGANLDEHLIPFMGTIPWEKLMKTLTEIGYEGDFVYEISTNGNMPDCLKDSTVRFSAEIGRYLLSLC